MPVLKPLIYFRCVNEDHQQLSRRNDTFTVHTGLWAYCPRDIRAKSHEWVETGGVALDELKRQLGHSE